jgi:hypothetical protein
MSLIYRNRLILNQRGASIDIDNTTEAEKIKISQRSGSNLSITNVVNSELATNNKQVNVVHDSFETTGNDKSVFVGSDNTIRTGQNTYNLTGFLGQGQIDSYKLWAETYRPIAKLNSQFKIKRSGLGYPNGDITQESGTRDKNPVIDSKVYTLNNRFTGYTGISIRRHDQDDVVTYARVPNRVGDPASERLITRDEIIASAGGGIGSKAPGVMEFGPDVSAASENGKWLENNEALKIGDKIKELQPILLEIEKGMGNGGDQIEVTKRHKFEQVGAAFNDYPSIRVDPKGRSQPLEMLVSTKGTYKNHDYVPHVEELDNSSVFPCGNDDKVIGNKYTRNVGSGGIQLKTTGVTELGGTTLKVGFKKININGSLGVHIGSESFLELQSLKTITLRTNRQVYIDGSLGVNKNLIVGGGASIEGELYVQHITAPLEVHQTQDTVAFGRFATDAPRKLLIGEADLGGVYYPVYALPSENLVVNYPHSHHHHGIAMRLFDTNDKVRAAAQTENINNHSSRSQSLPQMHERKGTT